MADPHSLQRFVDAQEGTYEQALGQIRAGEKRSHWIWFVFPQIAGLGSSPTSQHFAIQSIDEARAYLAHPLLGARLRECVDAMNALPTSSADDVLGALDAMKFRSSMTLFAAADPGEPRFGRALQKYFGGREDARTRALLSAGSPT